MAETRTGIVLEFESRAAQSKLFRRHAGACYPKPTVGRDVLISLLMCFPLTCMLWAVIIYGALRLAR